MSCWEVVFFRIKVILCSFGLKQVHFEIAEVNSLQGNFIKEKRGSQPCCPLNSMCIGNYLRPPIDAGIGKKRCDYG